MKITRERYQHGSVRRVTRASGFAWEFRYRVIENGRRVHKTQTFDGAVYPTEKAVRQKVQGQLLKLNEGTEYARSSDVTFNALLERYITEEMPNQHATRGGYTSMINTHLRPRWGTESITDIRPAEIRAWFKELDLAPVTKGHIRSLMHRLFDLATLWEYLPLERRNPVDIVKIRSVTRRVKEPVVLTPEQFCANRAAPARARQHDLACCLSRAARQRGPRAPVGRHRLGAANGHDSPQRLSWSD